MSDNTMYVVKPDGKILGRVLTSEETEAMHGSSCWSLSKVGGTPASLSLANTLCKPMKGS